MGMSQKQAVGTLYVISAILGLSAVVLTASGALKAMVVLIALALAAVIAWRIFLGKPGGHTDNEERKQDWTEEDEEHGPSER